MTTSAEATHTDPFQIQIWFFFYVNMITSVFIMIPIMKIITKQLHQRQNGCVSAQETYHIGKRHSRRLIICHYFLPWQIAWTWNVTDSPEIEERRRTSSIVFKRDVSLSFSYECCILVSHWWMVCLHPKIRCLIMTGRWRFVVNVRRLFSLSPVFREGCI